MLDSITCFMSCTYTWLIEIMAPPEFQFRTETKSTCDKIFVKNVCFSESYFIYFKEFFLSITKQTSGYN